MKKIYIISTLLLTLFASATEAHILTVSNSPIGAGQYTSIQTAINAASPGDTVYVNGSSLNYGNVTINKRITLIGAGYAVTGTQNDLSTYTGTITLDTVSQVSSATGSVIIGINTNGASLNETTNFFNNITIERCSFGSLNATGSNWVIENCIILSDIDLYNSSTNVITNMIIRNNFITQGIYANGVMDGASLLVDHNIIEGTITQLDYALITNNIFWYANISSSGGNNYNIYNNNITVYTSADVLPFGTNTGAGNLNSQAPSKVFSNGLTSSQTNLAAIVSYNWQLEASNTGHNGATDGTDIGMYGGLHPMPNLTGASTLPQITLLNIKNSSIPVNGTLYYEFKARQQN